MRNNRTLVTKEFHDSTELELNKAISDSIEIRQELVKKLNNDERIVDTNRKKYKVSKGEYKETIKVAKKDLREKIEKAKNEYKIIQHDAYLAYRRTKLSYVSSKFKKRKTNKKLRAIRSKISKLKSYKNILGRKYISEKDEYIDINKWAKVYKKIDNN